MNNLYVWVVQPPDYPHSQCFAEVAESIACSLDIPQHWGYAPITQQPEARAIVLGAHLLPPMYVLPHNGTIYNLEVIGKHTPIPYLDLMRSATVWDYSQQNITKLKEYGIEAKHVPIGYHECLTKIDHDVQKPIDVLFVGSMNDRRAKIIHDLRGAGVHVVHAFNCYGRERDDLIARSKIVLNMHYYEDAPFEIVRCSYLMANKVCVVSEHSVERDEWVPNFIFCPYDDLVWACKQSLDGTKISSFIMNESSGRCYDLFTKTSMEANLRGVLL